MAGKRLGMCTAITFYPKKHYFGRNLDIDYSYDESVVVVPRNYRINYSDSSVSDSHYAMIGMAYVYEDYPLFYDAMNEKGLAVAGLKFQDSCVYEKPCGKNEVASYEFIMWVLSDCADVDEAKDKLKGITIAGVDYRGQIKPQPLHWIIADKSQSVVVEQTKYGLEIYDNPVGVLTNNPRFDYHMTNLNNYINVTNAPATNRFSKDIDMWQYSGGLGGIGLPGDLSSMSRFVRATFVKYNSKVLDDTEGSAVNQFFHMLDAVSMKRGMLIMDDDNYEITVYSSCCNLDDGVYYYTTYENRAIRSVALGDVYLEGSSLSVHKLA